MAGAGERRDWHDQRGVTWAAGLAAVALIVLLVVAVVRTSSSSYPPGTPPAEQSGVTAPRSAGPTASASTTYTVPRVQTSDLDGPPVVSAAPTTEAPVPQDPGTPTTSTTTPNPYVTTTTPNAGAV